jgi:hypothetical protein
MTIYGLNMDGLGADSRQMQVRRTLLGALYGLLGGTVFVLVAAFVDTWLNPGLPLGVNWDAFALRMPLIGLGLGLVGAVTCWWHEAWQGLLSGALTSSMLALIAALYSSQVGTGLKFIVILFILLPIAAMTLPVAYFLRWLVERHGRALGMKWKAVRIFGLVLFMLAIAGGLGYLMKTSSRGIEAVRTVHAYLQDLSSGQNPLAEVAGVPERDGTQYVLYPTESQTSTEGFDVHVVYRDGYRFQCEVIVYPGGRPYLSGCRAEGE